MPTPEGGYVRITPRLSRYVNAWKDANNLSLTDFANRGVAMGALTAVIRRSQNSLRRPSFNSLANAMGHTPDQLWDCIPPEPEAPEEEAAAPAEPTATAGAAHAPEHVEMVSIAGKRAIVLDAETSDDKMEALGRIAALTNEQVVHLDKTVRELIRSGMEMGLNN